MGDDFGCERYCDKDTNYITQIAKENLGKSRRTIVVRKGYNMVE